MNLAISYSAGNIKPVKLMQRAQDICHQGVLRPYHVRMNLTNACNLECSYCMCSDRDKGQELVLDEALSIMAAFNKLGCRAVTITGGGEPLMHPRFSEFVDEMSKLFMAQGLVTNGTLLGSVSTEALRKLSWCRVSMSDDSELMSLLDLVDEAAERAPDVDWSFEYVVTAEFSHKKLARVVQKSATMNISSVRVISDLTDLANVPSMYDVRAYVDETNADMSKTIFQGRKQFAQGAKRCLVSLVRPVIDADGLIYPCNKISCMDSVKGYVGDLSVGYDIRSIWKNQECYDGSGCRQCYYKQYNEVLEILTSEIVHEEFV